MCKDGLKSRLCRSIVVCILSWSDYATGSSSVFLLYGLKWVHIAFLNWGLQYRKAAAL